MKYKCTCVSGGGTEQTSYWTVKKTPKTLSLHCDDIETIWGNAEQGMELKLSLNGKNRRHCLRIWEEDLSDFTVYPDQAGTPFHFEVCA
jgi:uncharacterized Zn finger protein